MPFFIKQQTTILIGTKMKTINELGLTELELKVLEAEIDLLYAEPGFSDIDCTDLAKSTSLKINTVKGVVGSLCKKGILFAEMGDFQGLIYLSSNYWYLHPVWKDEQKNLDEADDELNRLENGDPHDRVREMDDDSYINKIEFDNTQQFE